MKLEDYIDENHVPTKEDFELDKEDEKVKLRKTIKEKSNVRAIIYWILSLLFMMIGISDILSSSSNFSGAGWILIGFLLGYYGYVYYRIHQATIAEIMQQHYNKLGPDSLFMKLFSVAFGIIVGALISFQLMKHDYQWYVALLVFIIIAAIVAGLFLELNKHTLLEYEHPLGKEIERLHVLEEE